MSNTGGAVKGGPCKCPAGMTWVEDDNGINGGYCKCSADSSRTKIGNKNYPTYNNTSGYMVYGFACCPEGTHGWSFHQTANSNGPNGYQGSVAEGTDYATGKCFCPTGTGPKSSSSYQGGSVNATCACPTGTTWYEGNGCRKCPPGSTWDENCGQCLCDATDGYSTLGVYSQTNSCAQRQFNVPGAYYSTNTCSAGCTREAHYFDAGMNCCYCAAQAGSGHDAEHDSRGCLISGN